jgi:uncharacterized protein
MEQRTNKCSWIIGIIAFCGFVIAGYLISKGLRQFKTDECTVTVKGLAEREILSDNAYWPITYIETSNDLQNLNQQMESKRRIIEEFLLTNGFDKMEIFYSPPNVIDHEANQYNDNRQAIKFRYMGEGTVALKTKKVIHLKEVFAKSTYLLSQGVVLRGESYRDQITYKFSGLNSIKPEMIEEANKSARKAAEQFAKDSGSKLGKIKTAVQGLFSIEETDINTPELKKVRVVTTVQYYLN